MTSTGALAGATLGAGLATLRAVDPASGKLQIPDRSGTAPSSPVALLRCESYDPTAFRQALAKAFDLLGGIKTLVQNKTVAEKLNLTGLTWNPVFGLPAHETYQTQPNTWPLSAPSWLKPVCGASFCSKTFTGRSRSNRS